MFYLTQIKLYYLHYIVLFLIIREIRLREGFSLIDNCTSGAGPRSDWQVSGSIPLRLVVAEPRWRRAEGTRSRGRGDEGTFSSPLRWHGAEGSGFFSRRVPGRCCSSSRRFPGDQRWMCRWPPPPPICLPLCAAAARTSNICSVWEKNSVQGQCIEPPLLQEPLIQSLIQRLNEDGDYWLILLFEMSSTRGPWILLMEQESVCLISCLSHILSVSHLVFLTSRLSVCLHTLHVYGGWERSANYKRKNTCKWQKQHPKCSPGPKEVMNHWRVADCQ